MIITIVCDVLGQENNGTTIAAMNLIRYLESQNHTVKILCSQQENPDNNFYMVESRDFWIFNDYVKKNGVSLAKPDEDIIAKAIDGSDIVHIMLPFALGRKSAEYAYSKHIPVTAGFHVMAENFSSHIFMKNSSIVNRLTYAHFEKMYKYCSAIHYPTQYLRDLFEKIYGKTNGYVISNGVNSIFKPIPHEFDLNNKITILYSGRYSKEKYQSVLIKAIDKSKYKNKISLILAGTGPMKEKLEKLAKKKNVNANFNFYAREEMVKVINTAYLYVHAADIEAEGISCLEAISCGVVPIICNSPKSATKFYALDERSLYKKNDYKELAKKIDYWIDNPSLREEASKKYIEMSKEKFDQTACMKKMEEMLLETIANYKKVD